DVAPATPTNLVATGSTSGISLDWDDNTESDLAGYNIYRSDAVDGVFTKLNASAVAASQYSDSTAPAGATSYYQVVAVDNTAHESTVPATASAPRPANDDPPAQPQNFVATPAADGIHLAWDP